MSARAGRPLDWSRLGLRELFESFDHIAAENLPAAIQFREAIRNAAELIALQPGIGRPGQKPGTREYPIPGAPYTLIYRTGRRKITIGRVLHQRRRYP